METASKGLVAAKQQASAIARFRVKPGGEEKFKQEILSVMVLVRTEEGCLSYHLHQATGDRSEFILYGCWASKENLDHHLQMPYIQSLCQRFKDILAAPVEVNVWEKLQMA